MRAIPLKQCSDRQTVKSLYKTAFPKEEQMPWWLLRLLTGLGRSQITCYYQEDTFCGFTISASTQKVLFILFFAVAEGLRGQGMGSGILEVCKETAAHRPILLNVEPLDDQAENNPQRIQRMRFYGRNGFRETGYEIDEVGGTFRVLSTHEKPDMADYLQVFRHMSFGLWKPEIRKLKDGGTPE